MNREKAAELLPILKAFSEGKTIECRSNRVMGDWKEAKVISELSLNSYEYRIKPEPTYRPFANAEECWAEMQKHQPFGWVKQKDFRRNIANVMSKAITFADNEGRNFTFEAVFEDCKFADGTKFGIKEE